MTEQLYGLTDHYDFTARNIIFAGKSRNFPDFIFGSIADGKEKAESDVDLIVIGDLGLRELSGLLSGLAEKIGREINPHVFSPDEFSQHIDQNDPFLTRVISSSKLFIKGSEDDIGAVGE